VAGEPPRALRSHSIRRIADVVLRQSRKDYSTERGAVAAVRGIDLDAARTVCRDRRALAPANHR
jgi:hypothetical protein